MTRTTSSSAAESRKRKLVLSSILRTIKNILNHKGWAYFAFVITVSEQRIRGELKKSSDPTIRSKLRVAIGQKGMQFLGALSKSFIMKGSQG